MRPRRTYLAVPAHRRKMLEGAAASPADAVFMDLEDAVPPDAKTAALSGALAALAELNWADKHVAVRINPVTSSLAQAEVEALRTATRLDALIIPKTESVNDLSLLETWLDPDDAPHHIGLEPIIETAAGLVSVDAIAAAGGRLSTLHFGVGDFAASIGARSAEIGESPTGYMQVSRQGEIYASTALDLWIYPMMRLLVAARAYGLRAIDGPCGAFRDLKLTRAWAEKAAAMGFDGKQVIHPQQIEPTRAAFTPSAGDIAFAHRVVSAMEEAQAAGLGAVQLDGRMLDYANLRMAERILAMAGADQHPDAD